MSSQELKCQSPWTLNKLQLHTDWNFMTVTRWAPSDGKNLPHDARLPSWTFSYHQLIIDREVTFWLSSQGLFQGCACLHISFICSRMLSLYTIQLLVGGLCKKESSGIPSFIHFSPVPNSACAFRNLIALNIIPRTWLWMTVQHTRPLFATAYSTFDVMFLRQTKETNRTPCQCTDAVKLCCR